MGCEPMTSWHLGVHLTGVQQRTMLIKSCSPSRLLMTKRSRVPILLVSFFSFYLISEASFLKEAPIYLKNWCWTASGQTLKALA